MRIFLALNTNFLTSEPLAREWINRYRNHLQEAGSACELFDGNSGILPKGSIIHFFSNFDAENWKVLSESGYIVVVTPTLKDRVSRVRFDRLRSRFQEWLRTYLFRASNELIESRFRKSGRHYLVTSDQVRNELNQYWGISSEKISIMDSDPKNAALVASALYFKLSSI